MKQKRASVTSTGKHPAAADVRHLQVSDVKRLLVDVGGVGSGGQAPDTGQVPAVTAHGLDDEHASLGSTGRLLDAVARLIQSVHIGESNSHVSARTRVHTAGSECRRRPVRTKLGSR